ncbi:MAG: SDR family NAD(P)-dependent oxidoreductase [Chloroflexota bacterium]|nr:SDR family NAD(P)-dependent oxidoreductase [Chloroflexota bacterium]
MLIENRTVIVTGAARGIGAATARRMVEEGARVAIVDIDMDEAQQVATEIGSSAYAFQCDVSQPSAVETLVRDVVKQFGGVDILVNNAGICPRVSIEEMTESLFDKLININLKSVFFLSRAAAEAMKEHKWGRIVNLSSTGGRVGGIYNATVYGATKAGILAMTKSFARHYAPYNILVNAVAPGAVETRMMTVLADDTLQGVINNAPLKRLADPTEIANTIVFLSSEQASWMTGATLDVNGGTLML